MRMRKRERIRRSGIGGSDIAAVFGLSPWKTRYALYLEKTAAPEEEIPPRPTGEHAALYWALQQKNLIAKAYLEETGCKLTKSTKTVRDSNRRFFHGHPDFFLSVPEGESVEKALECVSCSFPNEQWGKEGSAAVPPYYALKVQWYMGLCPNLKSVDVAVLFSGREFRIYTIRRDDVLIAHLRQYAELFWRDHVEKRLPPAPLTEEEVREIYPQPVRKTVQATRGVERMIRHYRQICDVQSQAERIRKLLRDSILRETGDSAVLTDSKGTPLATFRPNASGNRVFRLTSQTGEVCE